MTIEDLKGKKFPVHAVGKYSGKEMWIYGTKEISNDETNSYTKEKIQMSRTVALVYDINKNMFEISLANLNIYKDPTKKSGGWGAARYDIAPRSEQRLLSDDYTSDYVSEFKTRKRLYDKEWKRRKRLKKKLAKEGDDI